MSDEQLREQYILLLIQRLDRLPCVGPVWDALADRIERMLADQPVPEGPQT